MCLRCIEHRTICMEQLVQGRQSRVAWVVQLARREVGLLVALFVAALLIVTFGNLAEEVVEGDTIAFDRAVVLFFRNAGNIADPLGPPWLEEMARDVTALGSFAFLGLILFSVVSYLLLIRKRATAVLTLVAVLGGVVISTFLK